MIKYRRIIPKEDIGKPMAITNPNLANLLYNKEDGYKYSQRSRARVDWICPQCGEIVRDKAIAKVSVRGVPCIKCSDGVSRPNKIMSYIFQKSNIPFTTEKSFKWTHKKRYDFYLYDINIVVEVNGLQHYEGTGFGKLTGIYPENQKELDKEKEELAIQNGISHVIWIDASDYSAEHIYSQVTKSLISKYYKIAPLNLKECEEYVAKSLVVTAATLYNQGLHTGEIDAVLHVSRTTTLRYLKQAALIGLCDYTPYKAQTRSQRENGPKKRVLCVTTGKIFNSYAEAGRYYNISRGSLVISEYCRGLRKYAGKINGIPLEWRPV